MPKKNKSSSGDKPKVHKDLKGFDIKINQFGEIETNFEVDQLNSFLNDNVEDKKLVNRERENEEPSEQQLQEEE